MLLGFLAPLVVVANLDQEPDSETVTYDQATGQLTVGDLALKVPDNSCVDTMDAIVLGTGSRARTALHLWGVCGEDSYANYIYWLESGSLALAFALDGPSIEWSRGHGVYWLSEMRDCTGPQRTQAVQKLRKKSRRFCKGDVVCMESEMAYAAFVRFYGQNFRIVLRGGKLQTTRTSVRWSGCTSAWSG